MFNPRSLLGVVGVMLLLVALYLVLEKAGGASQVIGTLAAGGLSIFSALQGRNVNAYGVQVSGTP